MLDVVSELVAKGEVEMGLTAIWLLLAELGSTRSVPSHPKSSSSSHSPVALAPARNNRTLRAS